MKTTSVRSPLAIVAFAGLASAASAQGPFVINSAGATLLQNQLVAPAITNDFIDADGDGIRTPQLDQLAVGYAGLNATAPSPRAVGANQSWWGFSYRAIGSVNGFQELVDFGSPNAFVTQVVPPTPGDRAPGPNFYLAADPNGIRYYVSTRSIFNRTEFINSGVSGLCTPATNSAFNLNNPAALPVRSNTTATAIVLPNAVSTSGFEATWAPTSTCSLGLNPFPGPLPTGNGLPANIPGGPSGTIPSPLTPQGGAAAGGTRIDIAPVDVPSFWAVRTGASANAAPLRLPGQSGYGWNSRISVGRDGTSGGFGAGFDNLLANLGNRNLFDPSNPGAQNNLTIFDTDIAFAPIAPMVNLGTGLSQVTQSELRVIFATGRRANGENLVAVTRDAGSGTRNGFYNTIGLDASWGVGDNVGGAPGNPSNNLLEDQLGSTFVPGNKAGGGNLERAVINHRLGIGYSGAERAVQGSAPASYGTQGRAEHALVKHDLTIGASANFVRPRIDNVLDAAPTNLNSWTLGGPAIFAHVGDPRNANEIGGEPGNTNQRMSNPQAAAFLNNITRSIESFSSIPTAPANEFSPGELIAQQLIIPAALDAKVNVQNPTQLVAQTPNQSLQNSTRGINALANAFFNNPFGSVTLNGINPTRNAGTYTDGNTGAWYVSQGTGGQPGTPNQLNYAAPTRDRNRIAYDFNGDGLRNVNDAGDIVRAFRNRLPGGDPNFAVWAAPSGTGPIAGAPGTDASIEILGDGNGDGNFNAADVRYWADGLALEVASGNLNRRAGFEAIDQAWQSQTGNNNFFGTQLVGPGGPVPYVLGASRFDLVGTGGIARGWAPVGANGVVDAADRAYIAAQIAASNGNGAWSTANVNNMVNFDLSADVTGDLIVNQLDLDAFDALFGAGGCYPNCDGSTGNPLLTPADFVCFLNRFRAGDNYANCDGSTGNPALTPADFVCFLNRFRAGC